MLNILLEVCVSANRNNATASEGSRYLWAVGLPRKRGEINKGARKVPASNAFVAEHIEKTIVATRPKYDAIKIKSVPSVPIKRPALTMIPPPCVGHSVVVRAITNANSPTKAATVEREPHLPAVRRSASVGYNRR